jgi:nucleotide-binding universal stress UspA family protein
MANGSPEKLRIVVGVDFSETSQVALQQAFDTALARRAESPEVHAVVVVDDNSGGPALELPSPDFQEQLVKAQALLSDQVSSVRRLKLASYPGEPPAITTAIQVRIGDPVDELVSVALELRASLVVVGTHGRRGLRRLVLGSVAERVARLAPCAVLIARAPDLVSMDSVPRVEPADPDAPPPPTTETHAYHYRSVLEPEPPVNHLL